MKDYVGYFGLAVSVIALGVSANSCELSKAVPAQVAEYQTASNAFSTYSEAFQDFDNVLRRPHLRDVFDGNPEARIARATDADFRGFYRKSQPALDAYDAYTSKVNRVREPWSPATNRLLMDAGTEARKAMLCYLKLQYWSINEEKADLSRLRSELRNSCKDEVSLRASFENASNLAIGQMQREVRSTLPN